jgi:hypothetical protein
VRWSSPLLFNDPFDTQLDFNPGYHAPSLIDQVFPRIEAMIYSAEPLPDRLDARTATAVQIGRQALQDCRALGEEIPPASLLEGYHLTVGQGFASAQKLVEKFNADWRESLRRMRVLCVSEVHDDLLMWSHYAECHRGAVFQLQCLPEKNTALCAAAPISYRPEIPILGTTAQWVEHLVGGEQLPLNETFRMMAFTKSEHWKYEHEWRCWVDNGRGGVDDLFEAHTLEKEEVFAVYLGCCMLPDDRNAICRIVRESVSISRILSSSRLVAAARRSHSSSIPFERYGSECPRQVRATQGSY